MPVRAREAFNHGGCVALGPRHVLFVLPAGQTNLAVVQWWHRGREGFDVATSTIEHVVLLVT
mgnify:CR=1 FL=1